MDIGTEDRGGVSPAPPARRQGRVLLGWMDPAEGAFTLTGRRRDMTPTSEQEARARRARDAVAARAPGIDQRGVEQQAPDGLDEYIDAVRGLPHAAPLFAAGARVAMVDLSRLCAIQPDIGTDGEGQATSSQTLDLLALARMTLPLDVPDAPSVQYDPAQRAWVFSSDNPNLHITGYGSVPVDGHPLYGFAVAVQPSFLWAVRCDDRYVLADGYHRAYGLLRRGTTHVPALVSDAPSLAAIGLNREGMLPAPVYMGDRPPTIADFLDDAVAADVEMPRVRKVVVLTGIEIQTAR